MSQKYCFYKEVRLPITTQACLSRAKKFHRSIDCFTVFENAKYFDCLLLLDVMLCQAL